MRVYVGSMSYFQIIDLHKIREFIIINEPFFKEIVKEEPRESNRGRKRIVERKDGNPSFSDYC